MKKLAILVILLYAGVTTGSPILSYTSPTADAFLGGEVGSGGDWTAVNKVDSYLAADGSISGYRGNRYTAQSLMFNMDAGFRIKANLSFTPLTVQNEIGFLFQFVSYTTTKTASGKTAFSVGQDKDFGLNITTVNQQGIAIRSGGSATGQVIQSFEDLGIVYDSSTLAIAEGDQKTISIDATYEVLKTGNTDEYNIRMWLGDDEANASEFTQVFAGTEGQELWFQNYNVTTGTKTADAKMISYSVEAIPEPATLGLLGLAAFGALLVRRRLS